MVTINDVPAFDGQLNEDAISTLNTNSARLGMDPVEETLLDLEKRLRAREEGR